MIKFENVINSAFTFTEQLQKRSLYLLALCLFTLGYSQNNSMVLPEDFDGQVTNNQYQATSNAPFANAHHSMVFKANENVVINNLQFCGLQTTDFNNEVTNIVRAQLIEGELIGGIYQPKLNGTVFYDFGYLPNDVTGDYVYSFSNLNASIPAGTPFLLSLFIDPESPVAFYNATFDGMRWACGNVNAAQTMCGYDATDPIQLGINPINNNANLRGSNSWNEAGGGVVEVAQHFGCFKMNYTTATTATAACTSPDFIKLTPQMLNRFTATTNMSRTNFDISSDLGLPAGSVLVTCSSVDVIDNNGVLSFSLRGNADNNAYWTVKYNSPKYLKAQHGGALKGNSYDSFKVNDGMPYTFTTNLQTGLTHSVSANGTYKVTNNTSTKIFNSNFTWESDNSSTQFDFEFHTSAISNSNGGSGYSVYVDKCASSTNNPPVITSSGGANSIQINVNEGTTSVTDIDSVDQEDGAETNLTYSLSGVDASLFTIDATGNISFINAPDYQNPTDSGANNVYDLVVTVTDSDGATDTQIVAIAVDQVSTCSAPDFIKLTPQMLNRFTATTNVSITNFDISSDLGLPAGSILVTCSSVDVVDNNGVLNFSLRGNADNDAYWTIKYNSPKYLKAQHGGALKGNSYDSFKVNDGMPYAFTTNLQAGLTHSVSANGTYKVTNNTSTKIFNSNFTWESNNSSTQFDFEFHTTAISNSNGGSSYGIYVDICGNAPNNPPVITSSGGVDSIQITIDEGTTSVTDIDSVDQEDGVETNLTYTLVGVDSSLFTIDVNGNISFINAPDYFNPTDADGNNVYSLIVIVTDSNGDIDAQTIEVTVMPNLSCVNTPPMGLPVLNPTELTSGGYDNDSSSTNIASPVMQSVAVNSNGIIATTGTYIRYENINFENLMFQNSDFSVNTAHLPMSIASQGNSLQNIVALLDGSFLYYDYSVKNFYQVTSDGTRTEVMSPFSPAYAPKMYVSKLGNYIYVAEPWGDVKKFTFPGGVEDTSFNYSGPANRNLYDVVEQSDGKVIVGIALEGPQRFNTDGSIDNTWTNIETGGSEALLALAVQSDDKVLVSGTQININVGGIRHRGLIRLNANGTHDTSFTRQSFSGLSGTTINTTGAPYDIEVNASDEIYIAGNIRSNTDENDTEMIPLLAKLDANGNMDLEFRNNVFAMSTNSIYGIKLQCDGKLLVMSRQGLSNLYHGGLVRIHANGVIDTELNNTPKNWAADLGLPENDAEVTAAATQPNPAAPSTEGLEVFYRMAGTSHYNSMVSYDFAKESSFNVTGFLPDPSGVYDEPDNTNLTFENFRRVSNDNIIFTHSAGRVSSIDADGNRRWIIDTGSNNRVSYADLSPDGTTLAFSSVTENNLYFLNTNTGVYTSPINVGIDGDIMYTPSGDYIFIKEHDNVPTLKRFDSNGTNGVSITMDAYPVGGGNTSSNFDEIHFYSDTDFYIYSNVENYNKDYLYKYKLTDAAGNTDPNGIFAKLDTAFGNNGGIDLGNPNHPGTSSGLRNQWTVDKYGNVYVGGRRHWAGTDLMGSNISRIGPVGVDVDPLYIRVGNVTGGIAIDLLFDIKGLPLPTIDAVADDFTATTFVPGDTTPSVFTNDDANGISPATDALLETPTITIDGGLTGVTINDDGTINIPTNAVSGSYTLTYKICLTENTSVCDTATVNVVVTNTPDYKPVILTNSTVVIGGVGNVKFRVLVAELNNIPNIASDIIEVRITKLPELNISFDPTVTTFNGSSVSNPDWVYDGTHPFLHKFIYTGNAGVFNGNTVSTLLINAIYIPDTGSFGSFPVKVTIKDFSGGEVNNTNNVDIEYIQFK